MKRRLLLKSLSASIGALLIMPAWANNWNLQTVEIQTYFLNFEQTNLLAEMVSTIIPEGKIQGAKSLGVPAFIEKMIKDFKKGLENVEILSQSTHNQLFENLSVSQKQELLKNLQTSTDAKQKEFYGLIKNLTIQGYTTSEYVMVNYLKYEMAPGHYYGCVNV
jgi:hypothetical protein